MALRVPASALMVGLLIALGLGASAASLLVQHHQSTKVATERAIVLTRGDPRLGRAAFVQRGCGACHAIPLEDRADGLVGPPLGKIATRAFLAGRQPNDPAHLIAWVQHPQAMKPGVGMPELGLSDAESRNLAAYLYTLR